VVFTNVSAAAPSPKPRFRSLGKRGADGVRLGPDRAVAGRVSAKFVASATDRPDVQGERCAHDKGCQARGRGDRTNQGDEEMATLTREKSGTRAGKGVRPDVIAHQHGADVDHINLLRVEVRKSSTRQRGNFAISKRERFVNSALNYIFTGYVCFTIGQSLKPDVAPLGTKEDSREHHVRLFVMLGLAPHAPIQRTKCVATDSPVTIRDASTVPSHLRAFVYIFGSALPWRRCRVNPRIGQTAGRPALPVGQP